MKARVQVRPIEEPCAQLMRNEAALITWVDAAIVDVLGWRPEDMVGRPSTEFIHPQDQPSAVAAWFDMLAAPGEVGIWRGRYQTADGSWAWVETVNRNELHGTDEPAVSTLIRRVAVDQVGIEEELRARKQLLSRLSDAVPVGMFELDHERHIQFTNDRLLAILNCSQAATAAAQFASVLSRDSTVLEQAFASVFANQPVDNVEIAFHAGIRSEADEQSSVRVCLLSMRPLTDSVGNITGAIGCLSDVSDAARLRRQLEHRASTDDLTGCLNRAATIDQLAAELSRSHPGRGCAAIFIDLNGLKNINDEHGHAAGDNMLRETAAQLRDALRADDSMGRLGGDEFLIICRDIDNSAAAHDMANRIHHAVNTDIRAAGQSMSMRASVGVAWTDRLTDPDELIRQADAAMYHSKSTPGTPAVLYRPDLPAPRPSTRLTRSRRHLHRHLTPLVNEGADRAAEHLS